MMQISEPSTPQATPPPRALDSDSKAPTCCREDMQILLRRAVLHSDGEVDFQIAWGCRICGRRIL